VADLRVGIALPGAVHPADAARLAGRAEAAGADAVWVLDVRRDPYLLSAAAITGTSHIQIGTNVAVAFARSPTATATAGWDLALWSGGRFVLGLGSQVGPTLEARFGVTADHPAPRMRDYVRAVRACFESFRRGYGAYEGEFYRLRRPAFQPGGEDLPQDPPVYVAAVNPLMASVAGEVGDGFAAHPFSTERYLREVLRPALERGAARAERALPPLLLQLVVAVDREAAATQMTAYTVPAYRRVLDHEGRGRHLDRVLEALRAGRRSEARSIVDAEFLDQLGVVVCTDPDAIEAALERWSPLADRLSLSVPWFGTKDQEQLQQTERLIDHIAELGRHGRFG
jgi:probable F420-dependent oxidoreductase